MESLFGLSPEDAYNYLENKGLKISFKYYEIKKQAHDRAFTAAGIMKTDILNDLHEELKRAMKEGVNFNEFKSKLKELLTEKGWYGKKEITNPKTGETRTINIDASRLKTIYTTNMQSAYAKARAKQLSSFKYKTYWVYKCALLENSRSEHIKMHNCAIHRDDEFWKSSFPPNDYNCKCKVIAVSEEEAKSKYKILTNPTPIASENFAYDKRENTQLGKLEKTELDKSLQDLPNYKAVNYDNLSDEEALQKVFLSMGIVEGTKILDKIGDEILINRDFFKDKTGKLKIKKENRHFYIDYYPELMKNPDEIYIAPKNSRGYANKYYIKYFYDNGTKALVMVIGQKGDRQINRSFFLAATPEYIKNYIQNGKLIYKKS